MKNPNQKMESPFAKALNTPILDEKEGIKNLKKILMKIHCISVLQAKFILEYFGDKTPDKTLKTLLDSRILYPVGEIAVSLTPKATFKHEVDLSSWFLMKYIDKLNLTNIYLAQDPSHLFCLLGEQMFEISVIEKGREEQIAFALDYRTKQSSDLQFIAILYDVEQLDTFFDAVSKYPKLNFTYALYQGKDENGYPSISIMSLK